MAATATTTTPKLDTPRRATEPPRERPLRRPSHAARRVTTALRGVDGRLAVVCG